MKRWIDKSLIEKIEEVLCTRYHMTAGSAVTQAIVYVIFNRNTSRLANEADSYEALAKVINPTMADDGIKHVIEIAMSFYAGVKSSKIIS